MDAEQVIESPLSGVICEKPFFDAVFMQSPTGIALTDSTGSFIDSNEMCALILGYSRSELIGKTFQEITHSKDILYDMRMFNAILKGDIETYQMAKRFIQKGGRTVWARVKVNAVRTKGHTSHLVKHIIQMEPVVNTSNALVNDFLGDHAVKRYMKAALALMAFFAISSVVMLLHVMGIV